MAINLASLDEVPETVILPSGREVPVRLVDAGTFGLAREFTAEPTRIDLVMPVLRRIMPAATQEELDSLTWPMISAVIQIACGRVAEVYALLGESSGERESTSPVSPPMTTSGTSSPA